MDATPITDIAAVRAQLANVVELIGMVCREVGIEPPVLAAPCPAPPAVALPRREPRSPVQRARHAYDERRRRSRHFSGTLFGEPAWDILLDLYIAAENGRDISVTSACIAADVPSTTGLRWLHILEAEGLVKSEADIHDGRRRFIRLTPDALARMKAYFADEPEPGTRRSREPGLYADMI